MFSQLYSAWLIGCLISVKQRLVRLPLCIGRLYLRRDKQVAVFCGCVFSRRLVLGTADIEEAEPTRN
jgi:hypothetical protein